MTTSAMPVAGTAIEQMDLAAVQAELGSYQPAVGSQVVSLEAWLSRRMRLWRRLDRLLGMKKPAAAGTN
jgi:hypothetical protein